MMMMFPRRTASVNLILFCLSSLWIQLPLTAAFLPTSGFSSCRKSTPSPFNQLGAYNLAFPLNGQVRVFGLLSRNRSCWHHSGPHNGEDIEAETGSDEQKKNESDNHGRAPAVHQVEHRATEKGAIAVSQKVAEQIVSSSTERIVERTGESLAERGVEHGLARAVEHAGEKIGEGAFQRFVNKVKRWSGSRAVEQVADHLAVQSGERFVERSGERVSERALEHGLARAAEQTGERVTERIGDGVFERFVSKVFRQTRERSVEHAGEVFVERSIERVAEQTMRHSGERMGERGLKQASENALEHVLERAGERGLERTSEAALERAGERAVEQATKRGVKRVSEKTSEKALAKVSHSTTELISKRIILSADRVALRLGRGLLIVLPALGGIFALYLLRSDMKRVREARSKGDPSYLLFTGAGLADGFDSVLHFGIARALLNNMSHHQFVRAEEASLACAIVSTICAVVGELVSHRIERRRKQAEQERPST